jgi:hypothetical protein
MAERFPAAKDSVWVVPRQHPIGKSHAKLASELYSRGNLLVWPNGVPQISATCGTVFNLPALKNRNYSGLVMKARMRGGNEAKALLTLLPGDAPYKKMPEEALRDLSGLVVTHHGGNFRGDHPPQAQDPAKCAYSFGTENSYEHPSPTTKKRHVLAGWVNAVGTPDGHVCLDSNRALPAQTNCSSKDCSFRLVQ